MIMMSSDNEFMSLLRRFLIEDVLFKLDLSLGETYHKGFI
jgi:hypothetical protein